MGVPDTSLLDLFGKVKSWVSRSRGDLSFLSAELLMAGNLSKICSECNFEFTDLCHKFNCRGCGRTLCSSCIRRGGSLVIVAAPNAVEKSSEFEKIIKSCKYCLKASKRHIEKIYPSESPRASPEPPSPCSGVDKGFDGRAAMTAQDECVHGNLGRDVQNISSNTISDNGSIVSTSSQPPSVPICSYAIRHGGGAENCTKPLSASEYYLDGSDVDSSSFSPRRECYSGRLTGSSLSDSLSRKNINNPRVGDSVQHEKEGSPISPVVGPFDHQRRVVLVNPEKRSSDALSGDSGVDDLSISQSQEEKYQKPLDFENNGQIWFPPPPEDGDDEAGSSFFEYDDDDDEIGESRGVFSSSGDLASLFPVKEKHNEGQKEPIRSVIHGHFRALVLQLLLGEGIKVTKEKYSDDWLDVVSNLAWQAANYVKPDTRRGGSMDPGAYVKVKCVASGKPSQSTVVKGVVCTKNIKHKRMISQYKNPRLLLLGGSLEYQRVHNQLASFRTLLEEELDHLKGIVSKIEALQTNVLLVEKSVSPYAQEYLLAKEISLVLNVKRPLLERIARCTGASITPSVDKISTSHLGHCELFRLEKVSEVHEADNQSNKRFTKTLMFFEGCPRRLGCTILLKGSHGEELRKIKKVVQYAVFAAHHLSLETSFLVDEGASLPETTLKLSPLVPEGTNVNNLTSTALNSAADLVCQHLLDTSSLTEGLTNHCLDAGGLDFFSEHICSASESVPIDVRTYDIMLNECIESSMAASAVASCSVGQHDDPLPACPGEMLNSAPSELFENIIHEEPFSEELERVGENEIPSDYFSAPESYESLLVSFSSRCVLKGTVCERSRLLRIKYYGSFDKPLGKYLRDDLFDQASYCRSCKEPVEAHVQCYTHQRGSLTVNVRRLSSEKLTGQQDGKIWMWHRCLKCAHVDGVPPATHRVVMSDAAWGLSFGKFLELSFSNHTTANRIASCGHSLQRDCLRFYGCGDIVAFFYFSPIEILSVSLPPSVLEFDGLRKRLWLRKEATELKSKMETLYAEIYDVLHNMEQKRTFLTSSDSRDFNKHFEALKELLDKEKNEYYDMLHEDGDVTRQTSCRAVDILELNSVRHSLMLASHVWEHRFCFLDSLLKSGCSSPALHDSPHSPELNDSPSKDNKSDSDHTENISELDTYESCASYLPSPHGDANLESNISANVNFESHSEFPQEVHPDSEVIASDESPESVISPASCLSDQIDSAWIGTHLQPLKSQFAHLQSEVPTHVGPTSQVDSLPLKRLIFPVRVYSFDSAMSSRERLQKSGPPSLSHLSSVRSFHASGDHRSMLRDPVSGVLRTYSQTSSPHEAQKLNSILSSPLSYLSSTMHVTGGARLLLPQAVWNNNLVIAVYDDEPTSMISYALSSKEHEDWICNRLNENEGILGVNDISGDEFSAASLSPWQSLGSVDFDYISYGGYGSEDASPRISSLFNSAKKSPHLRVPFEDDSPQSAMGKAKFSVTCYFAKQFDMLRRKCCPSEVDFVSSLSRCKKWSAQGGKSNVYFAKSMDERFIIKQVTKTELESFEEFAPEYFRYLNDSLSSGSPTCLAKVLGIYQISVKNLRGGKETKMDLMVMENLFFRRNISRIYDLKGSSRARYNQDTSGANKVLLDMNLLETLRTNPIFIGSKAKRVLERAVWNDTSFLASVDVMDYSLLVGVDEERKELVIGIIDFMRQYTWDKHLETWVKASGILGGPKNASPTIISPKQYKKRFRKAMTTYFLTVPDQWSSFS